MELRSRATPPAIRIVTTGPDFNARSDISASSSPIAHSYSPASTAATSAPSFDFSSPAVSPGYLRPVSPFTFSETGPSPAPSPGPCSPMLQPIQMHHPSPRLDAALSNDVGLLSFSPSDEPKYVGPSSSVSFARLIFADCRGPPESQNAPGLEEETKTGIIMDPKPLPELTECVLLSKAYFDTVQLQYPFIHRPSFEACLAAVLHLSSEGVVGNLPPGFTLAMAQFHVFLVLSVGAALIPTRADCSEGYYATALQNIDDIRLTGSLQGAQAVLLLAMRSIYASGENNLWYINAFLMAICVDLGMHKRIDHPSPDSDEGQAALKRRIFWCAYSLDRQLGVMLGRPFTLRDEELDISFPLDSENDDELVVSSLRPPQMSYASGAIRPNFIGATYLFRLVRILSEIRSTLYRVSEPFVPNPESSLPSSDWQASHHRQLQEIRESARMAISASRRHSTQLSLAPTSSSPASASPTFVLQLIDLKYHECIQLLFRRSRAFPIPTPFALQQCFTSGIESVRILIKLWRQNELPMTRLTAHTAFLFGVTMLWAYRSSSAVQSTTPSEALAEDIRHCSGLLADLAKRFTSAAKSKVRFDLLAQQTLQGHQITPSSLNPQSATRLLSPHDTQRRSISHSPSPSPGSTPFLASQPLPSSSPSSPTPKPLSSTSPASTSSTDQIHHSSSHPSLSTLPSHYHQPHQHPHQHLQQQWSFPPSLQHQQHHQQDILSLQDSTVWELGPQGNGGVMDWGQGEAAGLMDLVAAAAGQGGGEGEDTEMWGMDPSNGAGGGGGGSGGGGM